MNEPDDDIQRYIWSKGAYRKVSEPDGDLPRYAWSFNGSVYDILRRDGLYGQTVVTRIWPPIGAVKDPLQEEIANFVCEYLDRRDREREVSGR